MRLTIKECGVVKMPLPPHAITEKSVRLSAMMGPNKFWRA